MRIWDIISDIDSFSSNNFLNHNRKSQYATRTGCICSFIIKAAFMVIFLKMILRTIAKQQINWSMDLIEQNNELFTIKNSINQNKKYYFAVGMKDVDLNDKNLRYFDVTSHQRIRSVTQRTNNSSILLEPCNINQWNLSDNSNFSRAYNQLKFDNLLCPQQNQQFTLQGQYSSQSFKYIDFIVSKCDPSLNPQRPCANDSEMNKILQKNGGFFFLNIYYINTLIEPNSNNYVTYFLQDRNYIQFTPQFGGLLNIYFLKYTVKNDKNIVSKVPWHGYEPEEQYGVLTNSFGQIVPRQTKGNQYAKFILRRASTQIIYKRSYQTLFDTLSYIGGLFSAILAFFAFFFNPFSQISYKIESADRLCDRNQRYQKSKNFNFVTFIKFQYFKFLKWITCGQRFRDWRIMKDYEKDVDNIEQFFDIVPIIEKITYLEAAVLRVLQNDQAHRLLILDHFEFQKARRISQRFKQNNFQPLSPRVQQRNQLQLNERRQQVRLLQDQQIVPQIQIGNLPQLD